VTRISYTLSEPATVRFRILRRKAGRIVNGTCRALAQEPTPREVRSAADGQLRRSRRAGQQRVRFRGHLGGRKLKPERYELVAVATDAAPNRSPRKRVAFRIVKP